MPEVIGEGLQDAGSQSSEGSGESVEGVGGAQVTGDNWRDSISEEYATHSSMADIKDLNSLAKSYIHAQQMVGADKVGVPREDWTKDDWDSFYNTVGRPETEQAYNLNRIENTPQGYAYNEEYEDSFKKAAHGAGLTSAQADKTWNFIQEQAISGYNSIVNDNTGRINQEHQALRTEWGKAYDQNMKLVNKIASIGGQDFLTWIKETGVGREPQMLKFAAKIGKMLSEDRITDMDVKTAPVFTPREAQSKINKIMGDAKHPYHDAYSPAHADAVDEVAKLFEQAHPEEVERE